MLLFSNDDVVTAGLSSKVLPLLKPCGRWIIFFSFIYSIIIGSELPPRLHGVRRLCLVGHRRCQQRSLL